MQGAVGRGGGGAPGSISESENQKPEAQNPVLVMFHVTKQMGAGGMV